MIDVPTLAKILNSAMVVLLTIGLCYRRRPRRHIPIMLAAFAGDLINVLVIELNRGAIDQALTSLGTSGFSILDFHIIASVLFLTGYIVAGISGFKLYRHGRARKVHKVNAAIFIVTRLASFVSSFFLK